MSSYRVLWPQRSNLKLMVSIRAGVRSTPLLKNLSSKMLLDQTFDKAFWFENWLVFNGITQLFCGSVKFPVVMRRAKLWKEGQCLIVCVLCADEYLFQKKQKSQSKSFKITYFNMRYICGQAERGSDIASQRCWLQESIQLLPDDQRSRNLMLLKIVLLWSPCLNFCAPKLRVVA